MIVREKTFQDWLFENFDKQKLKDLAYNGANIGWPGLSYYSDTCQLYNKFKSEIWEFLSDDAESLGCNNIFELISGFGGAKDVDSCERFENLMVWYAAEKLAREIVGE